MNRYRLLNAIYVCVVLLLTSCTTDSLKLADSIAGDMYTTESQFEEEKPSLEYESTPGNSVSLEQTQPNLTESVVWEKSLLYCDGLGKYSVTIGQSCEEDGHLITTVSVLDPEGVLTQSVKREDITNMQYDRLPCLEDLNQDGYMDIVLPAYGTLNHPNIFYVWNPNTLQFEEVRIQSAVEEINYLNDYEVRDNCIAVWTKQTATETLYQEYQWRNMNTLFQVYEEVITLGEGENCTADEG